MNLGEIRQQGLDRLGAESTNTALVRMIDAGINAEAALVHAKKNWDWLKDSAALAVTGASTAIALPATCRSVVTVVLRSTGAHLRPRRMDLVDIERGGVPTVVGRGTPVTWDIWGGNLFTAPYPAIPDTLDIWFYRKFIRYTAVTDVPLFDEDYHQILVEGALMRLTAADTFDDSIRKEARRNRDELFIAMMHTANRVAPTIRQEPLLRRNW